MGGGKEGRGLAEVIVANELVRQFALASSCCMIQFQASEAVMPVFGVKGGLAVLPSGCYSHHARWNWS